MVVCFGSLVRVTVHLGVSGSEVRTSRVSWRPGGVPRRSTSFGSIRGRSGVEVSDVLREEVVE